MAAKTNTNTTTKDVATNARKAFKTSSLCALKAGIIQCHHANNRKAMTLEDCGKNATSNEFNNWIAYCEQLRQYAQEYSVITQDKSASDEMIQRVREDLYDCWSSVLTAAMGEKFSRKWFIRKDDTAWLLRAAVRNVNTAHGSAYGIRTITEFRREVERFIGCRIASNSILDDDKIAVIEKYEKAVQRVSDCKNKLYNGDKKHASLEAQLEAARSSYDKTYDKYVNMGLLEQSPEIFDILMKDKLDVINDVKGRIERTKNNLSDALQIIADYGKRYKEIMLNVRRIEDGV